MRTGRVIEVRRTNLIVRTDTTTFTATVRGAFHAEGDFPKVGDYVEFEVLNDDQAVIAAVLPRTSVIKRKSAETDDEQIIAANVDLLLIVMGLDGDFNLSRLERYILLAKQCDIEAVIILNKMDVASDLEAQVTATKQVAEDIPVLTVSALSGEGLAALDAYLQPGRTSVLLGSSGAGKSTITNHLLGEARQATFETRDDDSRGRHTTTARHLFELPNGAFLIDTPGIRELGVLESDLDDQLAAFSRIEALAERCRFRNCDHERSAGCAVIEALETGDISDREWQNYQKLVRERAFLDAKESKVAERHYEQNQKRQAQKNELIRRRRLSGR